MSHLPPLKAVWCAPCQTWVNTQHHHLSRDEWRDRALAAEARAERLRSFVDCIALDEENFWRVPAQTALAADDEARTQ